MMGQMGKFVLFVVVTILLTVLLLFCLAFLAISVGVTVTAGSNNYNNCKENVSFCKQMHEQAKRTSFRLMTAASVVTILVFPAITTVVVYFLLELVSGRAGKMPSLKMLLDTLTGRGGAFLKATLDEDFGHDEGLQPLEFHDYKVKKLDRKKLQKLTVGPGVVLYFAFICFTLTLTGALWMLVIAHDTPSQKTTQLWPFIVTELIMELTCPLLACIGGALFSIASTYIMAGQVDMRIIIHRMLPSVMLQQETTEGSMYWVIAYHFYIKLKEPTGEAGTLSHAVDRNMSTWILAIISALAVVLSVSSFINRSFVQTLTVPITEFLKKSDICLTYSCFTPVTFEHLNVNCSEVKLVDLANINSVHCFKFIPLSSEIIANLSISVGFYIAVVNFLQAIFVVATVIHVEKSHIVWGIAFFFTGILAIIGAMVYILLPRSVPIQFDVILAGQILLVAIYLVLIGILLCTGQVHVIEKKLPDAVCKQEEGNEEGQGLMRNL